MREDFLDRFRWFRVGSSEQEERRFSLRKMRSVFSPTISMTQTIAEDFPGEYKLSTHQFYVQ